MLRANSRKLKLIEIVIHFEISNFTMGKLNFFFDSVDDKNKDKSKSENNSPSSAEAEDPFIFS